jgi:hypothetical protein
VAARQRGNPYAAAIGRYGQLGVKDHGLVVVSNRDDLTLAAGVTGAMTTTAAARTIEALGAEAKDAFTMVTAGGVA